MSELTEWNWLPLAELIEDGRPICYGVLKPGDEDPEGVPLIRIVDIGDGRLYTQNLFRINRLLDQEFKRSRVAPGDLLLSIQGTIGRVAIVPSELQGANISRTIARISFADDLTPSFYKHWIKSNEGLKATEDATVGSTRSSLNLSVLKKVPVPLPPRGEMSKVADVLDIVDTQIQKTKALIAKLEKVKEALLHDLLTRGIDESGRLRPSPEQAPELYKESPLGLIPREWSVSTLGERLSQYGGFIQTGPFGSQLHAEEYVREGVPVVMPQDMRDIEVSKENIAQITEERAEDLARHRVGEGDLLFSRRGDLSRCSFMSSSNKGWLCGTGCLLLRPAEHIDGFWLANIYKLSAIQSQVYGMAVGSTMVNLNSTILKNIVIPFPAFQEQSKIAEAIKSSKNKIFEEINILSKLKLQKIGLIDDLLTGRVRVTPLLDQAQATTPA
jgi:type I restriction enzyme S subunit|tara:strand:+ start:3170 stop:4498 length:1329 start_codon:yes stop_codon:yes gene_type:complete